MKRFLKRKLLKPMIKFGIVSVLTLLISILIYQYTILFNLKQQNMEYLKTLNILEDNITYTENKIKEFNKIMDDELLLDDYAIHNNYHKTDEIYMIK